MERTQQVLVLEERQARGLVLVHEVHDVAQGLDGRLVAMQHRDDDVAPLFDESTTGVALCLIREIRS